MTRYFGVLVAIVFVIGGIIFAYKKYDTATTEAARNVAAERIRADYHERVGWHRVNPDEKAYRDEVTTFFRWYFKEVNEHQNRFGGNKEFDEYLDELDARAGKGGKGADRIEEKKQTYEYVKKVFDQMKSGNYSPTYTATDKGIRLDILSTDPVMSGGEEKIRYQLVIWGIPKEMREDDRKVKSVKANAGFDITWKMYGEGGRLLGEMNLNGDPASKIEWPERYNKWFPPGFVLGHYDVDKMLAEFPPDKEKKDKGPVPLKYVEILFHISSRSQTGGSIDARYTWKLDVPAEWKLKPGSEWKGATDSIRPEEEIDPSKQAKKN
jgi:hypothetical protein